MTAPSPCSCLNEDAVAQTIHLKATDGSDVAFVDEMIGAGGMKDVFFSPDRSYVVAFFRDPQDFNSRNRLETIIDSYRSRIFEQAGGEYWRGVFCWPTKIVEHNGRLGVVAPTYDSGFFFEHGSKNSDFIGIKGKEKEGKWFASAKHRKNILDEREKGDWRAHLAICIKISRAVRRLHMAGLAHSDLSYKNVLVDPSRGNACIIDIDGLVVPGKFPPDVLGTPDFIAPEVMATLNLPLKDPNRALPRIETDRHALAVLVYMYLLYRHPLRGRKVFDTADDTRDESLRMGSAALFIEHPSDQSNRPARKELHDAFLPWGDPDMISYEVVGPYLKELFDKAFVSGLHNPAVRPSADEWERALVKTVDLIQPCQNKSCEQGWFVFANTRAPKCPFCGQAYQGQLPILNLFSSRGKGRFLPDNHRLTVYDQQYLYPWHVNRLISPSERLTAEERKPVGYFVRHHGKWVLVNQALDHLRDLDGDEETPIGQMVELKDGQRLLLSADDGGKLVHVQLVGE